MGKHTDSRALLGRVLHRLTVLQVGIQGDDGCERFLCLCVCGVTRHFRANHVKRGETRSCGCLSRDLLRDMSTTHGRTRQGQVDITWRSWNSMWSRCRSIVPVKYRNYKGRGITICDRWRRFENFLADMGDRPGLDFSIDRINNNGNYEPGNCRWATSREQAVNRRPNKRGENGRFTQGAAGAKTITYNNESHTVSEWVRITGFSRATFRYRIEALWPLERMFQEPSRFGGSK